MGVNDYRELLNAAPWCETCQSYHPVDLHNAHQVKPPAAINLTAKPGAGFDLGAGLFLTSFNEMAERVYLNAVAKGFYDCPRCDGKAYSAGQACLNCDGTGKENPNKPERIALMHSELSEALEAIRHGNPADSHCPEFTNLEVELADACIRIMDFSRAEGLRIAEAIVAKHNYNTTRPHKHGKAF